MPHATETLRLAICGAVGRRTATSQRSRTRRRSPLPSAPSTRARSFAAGTSSGVAVAVGVEGDPPVAERGELLERSGQVDHLDHGDEVEGARGRLGHDAAELGAAPLGQDYGAHLESRGRAQDSAEIVRIVDLVEHQHHIAAGLRRASAPEVEPGQRRRRQGQALVDGTFAEQAVDRGAFDHAHLHPSTLGGGS